MSGRSSEAWSRRWRAATPLVIAGLALPVGAVSQPSRLGLANRQPAVPQPPWADSIGAGARPAWLGPLASAVVPGAGQLLRGDDRAALYLVAEAFLGSGFLGAWREGRREGSRFRDLAFSVARAGFAPSQRDTIFEYFEQMGRFVESGPFDTDPGSALLPPTDERTYNGSIWALARKTFFANPDSIPDPRSAEYVRALEFYRKRAIGPNFAWSWRNAGLEQDLFRQTIRNSDDSFRRAQRQIGLMLANHIISAVDVYVSQRLARSASRGKARDGRFRSLLWTTPDYHGGAPDRLRIWLMLRLTV